MKTIALALLSVCALRADDAVAWQFNGRVSKPSGVVRDLGADATGGGLGFALVAGREPLRLRVRMDRDAYPGSNGTVTASGLGAEAILVMPTADAWQAFVSLGPAFEQWQLGTSPARTTNKAALRAEVGFLYKDHVGFCVGALTGPTLDGRRATCTYLGISFTR